jgi:hypothetical protein
MYKNLHKSSLTFLIYVRDDLTNHIASCEMFDHDNFTYTIRSFRKGVLQIEARQIRTGKELNALLEKQANTAVSFVEISKM